MALLQLSDTRVSHSLCVTALFVPWVKQRCSVLQPGLWLCVGAASLGAGLYLVGMAGEQFWQARGSLSSWGTSAPSTQPGQLCVLQSPALGPDLCNFCSLAPGRGLKPVSEEPVL